MLVLYASLRFPIYSIKLEDAYQVGASHLLPSPSAIIGSFLQSLARTKPGIFYGRNMNEATSDALSFANEYIITATCKALEPVIPASIILNRWKILEEKGKKMGPISYEGLKDYAKVRDARIREYITSMGLKIFLLFHDVILERITNDELKIALFNINRLGDTESLSSVIEEPKLIKAQPYTKHRELVSTLTPARFITNLPFDVVYSDMYSLPNYGKYVISRKYKDEGKLQRYILPLKPQKFDKFYAYVPSVFEAEPIQGINIIKVDDDKILVASSA
ncbi:MAG: type I-A CRISPR-associated protein Cas5a [Candidatus Bathyarchaeia archaeon]